MDPIDLDHNAATPVDPAVLDAMLPYLRARFGNPSSDHIDGDRAREAVVAACAQLAALLEAHPDEVILTGGSDANNPALFGVRNLAGARHTHHHRTEPDVQHAAAIIGAAVQGERR